MPREPNSFTSVASANPASIRIADHSTPRSFVASGTGAGGPFSLGGEGALRDALAGAGFQDIGQPRVPSPLKMISGADCVGFEKEPFEALHTMLAGLDEASKDGN